MWKALNVETHQLQQLKEIFPNVEENTLIAATQYHIELNDMMDAIMAAIIKILHYTLTGVKQDLIFMCSMK